MDTKLSTWEACLGWLIDTNLYIKYIDMSGAEFLSNLDTEETKMFVDFVKLSEGIEL